MAFNFTYLLITLDEWIVKKRKLVTGNEYHTKTSLVLTSVGA